MPKKGPKKSRVKVKKYRLKRFDNHYQHYPISRARLEKERVWDPHQKAWVMKEEAEGKVRVLVVEGEYESRTGKEGPVMYIFLPIEDTPVPGSPEEEELIEKAVNGVYLVPGLDALAGLPPITGEEEVAWKKNVARMRWNVRWDWVDKSKKEKPGREGWVEKVSKTGKTHQYDITSYGTTEPMVTIHKQVRRRKRKGKK